MGLADALARGVAAFRERHDVTLDAIAEAATLYGLRWDKSSVRQFERGTRVVSADELVLLPFILSRAAGIEVGLRDLLVPPLSVRTHDGATGQSFDLTPLLAVLGGATPAEAGAVPPMTYVPRSAMDEQLAAELGVPPLVIASVAFQRFGRTAREERDARADERSPGASGRRRQAIRGHVTREVLEELRQDPELDRVRGIGADSKLLLLKATSSPELVDKAGGVGQAGQPYPVRVAGAGDAPSGASGYSARMIDSDAARAGDEERLPLTTQKVPRGAR